MKRFLLIALACLAVLLILPSVALATIPTSYQIKGVPYYSQLDSSGCGAASLEMVFGYWGPQINYKEIVDAACSDHGTALPNEARAGQFSWASYAEGYRYPGYEVNGYSARSLGYAAFYYASTTPWLDQLKAVIAQGYPVICLTDWLPGVSGPHYRVVTGYNDTTQMLTIEDAYPWGCDTDPYIVPTGTTWLWPYKDFLSVWALSTDNWGVPGLNYGAVVVAPWKVVVKKPAAVHRNQTFRLKVQITYPCPAPFGDSAFPTFDAAGDCARVHLKAGITDVDGEGVEPAYGSGDLATLQAGETTTIYFHLRAGRRTGSFRLPVVASGTVSGSLAAWSGYPAYNYADRIGGSGSTVVRVIK